MTKFAIILVIFGIITGLIGFAGFQVYDNFYGVPKDAPKDNYTLVLESGTTLNTVAEKLEEDKVINSSSALLWHSKASPIQPLQEGTYVLNLNGQKPEEILTLLDQETLRISKERQEANKKPTVKVTIREGLQLDQVFAILEEKGVTPAADLAKFATDPANFDKKVYEFLPEPLTCTYGDLNTCAKYYIEGYAYPNTYDFFTPSTPQEVFKKMLDSFQATVWQKVKPSLNGQDFYKAVTLASVLEKETGRPKTGITPANRDEVNVERQTMAQVFYNRLENNQQWGSDVTAEYGHGRRLCQQTLKIENCIFIDSPEAKTLYNTYLITGYPIGPVTSPEFDNIFAALNPTPNDFIYFVSDATGKKYFSVTEREFNQSIEKVKEINRSLGV